MKAKTGKWQFRVWLAPGMNSQMLYSEWPGDRDFWRNYNSWLGETKVLTQCTGLVDKDGEPIFEGDIVAHQSGLYAVVVFQAPAFVMKEAPKAKHWTEFILAPSENQFQVVVGNIFQNPEMAPKGKWF